MNIGIDLDEVVVKLIPPLLDFFNTKYNNNLTEDDINCYGFNDLYGITFKEFTDTIDKFYLTPQFSNLKPILGAEEGIKRLHHNHKLFAITARPISTQLKTNLWLQKYVPGQFYKVIYDSDTSKGDICLTRNIDYLVDDHIKHIEDACSKGIKCLLMDRPWNREHLIPEGAKIVYDWKDIERELK